MKRRNFLLSSTSAIAASTIVPEMVAVQAARSANSKDNSSLNYHFAHRGSEIRAS